jgi:type IV pilus assembly protein PilA
MKNSIRLFLTILCLAGTLFPQNSPAPRIPQNARQALLDMFFGKPGSLEKHLPEATRRALREAAGGGPSPLDQFSAMSSQLNSVPDTHFQTFETGSVLMSVENTKAFTKFEAVVEKDDLRGDEDEIELSYRMYKNGEPDQSPVLPTLTFLMKQEKNVWRLSEITATARIALADPALLKALATAAKVQRAQGISGSGTYNQPPNARPTITLSPGTQPKLGAVITMSTPSASEDSRADELSAIASMRTIVTAEVTYFSIYPSTGFTCSLSDLDGFGQGTPNEHQAMLIESRLASGKKRGYIFTLNGCGGVPNAHFQLTAIPADNAAGRAFCTDESAVIRASADGQAASCLARGTALQ